MALHHPVPARHGSAFAPGRRWRTWTALAIGGLVPAAGCYSTLPVRTAPAAGATVMLDINDRGRVALGDHLGPAVARVEGIIDRPNDSVYVLRIASVKYLNGQSNRWSGEPFSIASSLVSGASERIFSRTRTIAVGTALIGALVAAVITANFVTRGSSGSIGEPPPGGTS